VKKKDKIHTRTKEKAGDPLGRTSYSEPYCTDSSPLLRRGQGLKILEGNKDKKGVSARGEKKQHPRGT